MTNLALQRAELTELRKIAHVERAELNRLLEARRILNRRVNDQERDTWKAEGKVSALEAELEKANV